MWFKASDQLAFHQKTIRAGNAAMGLWIRSGTWLAGQKRTDAAGVMTVVEARTMGTAAEVKKLIEAGFWEPCRYQGQRAVRFHDWIEYQPDAPELVEKRADWAARKRRSRAHKQGDHAYCLPSSCDDAPPLPDEPDDDAEHWSEHG